MVYRDGNKFDVRVANLSSDGDIDVGELSVRIAQA